MLKEDVNIEYVVTTSPTILGSNHNSVTVRKDNTAFQIIPVHAQ